MEDSFNNLNEQLTTAQENFLSDYRGHNRDYELLQNRKPREHYDWTAVGAYEHCEERVKPSHKALQVSYKKLEEVVKLIKSTLTPEQIAKLERISLMSLTSDE